MTSPPRGYSWPPFEPGNVAAVRHGTFSSRRVAQVAQTLRPTLAGTLQSRDQGAPDRRGSEGGRRRSPMTADRASPRLSTLPCPACSP
jgi:hypothetical protein